MVVKQQSFNFWNAVWNISYSVNSLVCWSMAICLEEGNLFLEPQKNMWAMLFAFVKFSRTLTSINLGTGGAGDMYPHFHKFECNVSHCSLKSCHICL